MRIRLGVHVPHTPIYITSGGRRRRSRGNVRGFVSGASGMASALGEMAQEHQAKVNSPEYQAQRQAKREHIEAKRQANHEHLAEFRAEQAGRSQWPYIVGVLLVVGLVAGVFFWPVALVSIVGLFVWFPLARRNRRQAEA